MALLLDTESDTLLEELSRQTGESASEAIRHSLRERLERLNSPEINARAAAIHEIQERVAARPSLDMREADQVLGYNEQGLFD